MSVGAPARSGVCLNLHGAQNTDYWDRGIARYIVEHAAALLTVAPDLVHSIRTSPDLGFTPSLVPLLGSGKVERTHLEPVGASGGGPAIYHIMSPLEWGHPIGDVWPTWARNPALPLVVTLYDLIMHLFPEEYGRTPHERVAFDARLELVRRADHVLAISEHTAADAERELGISEHRISVIQAGATSHFLETWPDRGDAEAFVRGRFGAVDRPFVFNVGGEDSRKNLPRLVKAWALLSPDVRRQTRLVISCGLSFTRRAELERTAARHGLAQGELVLTGRVSDRELAALYRACALFVFPSLYEGWGLPILEAMTAGAPVIAARASTGPEILGETDGTFDPTDVADIARSLAEALADPRRLDRYRSRSRARVGLYSWEGVAERSVRGYERALASRRRVRGLPRRARPTVALLAPTPRFARPVDLAFERLATALAPYAEVELIHGEREPAEDAYGPARYALRRGCCGYDRVVHVVGNEPGHRHAYEALRDAPGGIAFFESSRLDGFHRWYGTHGGDPLWLRRQLETQYGATIPSAVALRGTASGEESGTHGLFFTREIQRLASRCIAPSRLAAEMLRVDRRGEALKAAVTLAPPPSPLARRSGGAVTLPPAPVIVAAEPWGSGPAATLVHALVLVRRVVAQASLILLGPGSDEERLRLSNLASALDLGDAVDLPATLTATMLATRLAVASAGVLPAPLIDANSVAFAGECLAAGVPIVASEIGLVGHVAGDAAELVRGEPSAAQLGAALIRILADADRAAELRTAGLELSGDSQRATQAELWLEALDLA